VGTGVPAALKLSLPASTGRAIERAQPPDCHMRLLSQILALLALLAAPARAASVLMISIDGLRPGDVTDADRHVLKIPTPRALAAPGVRRACAACCRPPSWAPWRSTWASPTAGPATPRSAPR